MKDGDHCEYLPRHSNSTFQGCIRKHHSTSLQCYREIFPSPDSSWGEIEASRQIIACRKQSSATNCQGIGRCFIASAISSLIRFPIRHNATYWYNTAVLCRVVPPCQIIGLPPTGQLRRVSDPIIIYPVPKQISNIAGIICCASRNEGPPPIGEFNISLQN